MKKYKINRPIFINWAWNKYTMNLKGSKVKEDLIISGEYILTANELLIVAKNIPTELLEDYKGKNVYIDGTECQLIYKQPFV